MTPTVICRHKLSPRLGIDVDLARWIRVLRMSPLMCSFAQVACYVHQATRGFWQPEGDLCTGMSLCLEAALRLNEDPDEWFWAQQDEEKEQYIWSELKRNINKHEAGQVFCPICLKWDCKEFLHGKRDTKTNSLRGF